MTLKVLINGAGVAGPAVANFLLRSNRSYDITLVERAPQFRTGGTQIDLRAEGIPIMRKLGLLDAARKKSVNESGFVLVGNDGSARAAFGVNDSGHGKQSFTSEYEIMRADLVAVLVGGSELATARAAEAKTGSDLRYELGKYAVEMTQGNGSSGGSSSSSSKVAVRFSDGSSAEYDLVIGADGQNSRTRRLMLQGETDDSALFNTLGVYYAYFQMPKIAGDAENRACECYHIPGSKVAIARHGHPDFTQVIFAIRGDTKELEETVSLPVEQQKALFTRLFKGTGWKIDHLLDGMESSDDFYMHVAAQANLETWSKGRIVLVGDAGYCASPLSGLGTTVSLVGAYVLAGELARHGDDVSAALASYEKVLRPFIKTAYVLPPGVPGLAFWVTIWGIKFFHFVMWLIAFLRIDKIVTAIEPAEKAGWKLPEYPELDLEE